ncbi:MAG: indolepyruvate ferredoxin oxidoreductase subunit alpha, partial [Desulfurococcales archaeon ex4484_42]
MSSHKLLLPPGSKALLMGNEAIARGAIEAGVKVVSGYPGTPSSEVIMSLSEVANKLGMYVEWATNEKVGFEICLGASFAGIRSLCTMKAPGLNVASDSIVSAAYSGVKGGLTILVADDPGPHTTQTEQDSRWFAELSKLPMIEPSDPQEAKDFTKLAYELSEGLKLPIILRTTTRVNHTVGNVSYGDVVKLKRIPKFVKDIQRYVRASMKGNLARHKWLNNQLSKAEDIANELGLNKVLYDGKVALVTDGVVFNHVYESVRKLGIENKVKIIKLGLTYPLPKKFLLNELSNSDKVLVIEELDPYLETKIRALVQSEGLGIEVLGKESLGIPLEGELTPSIIAAALSGVFGKVVKEIGVTEVKVPPRPPPMCAGCPHRLTYYALLKSIRKCGYDLNEVPIMGDIGCYALSYEPPYEAIWTEHAMGASIGLAIGLKVSGYDKPVIATIGDSTFYHAGIPALIEAIHKNIDILIVVLDNLTVAMTGHQSTPESEITETGRKGTPVPIESLVKDLKLKFFSVINPYNIDEAIDTFVKALKIHGPKLIISRAPCALLVVRKGG